MRGSRRYNSFCAWSVGFCFLNKIFIITHRGSESALYEFQNLFDVTGIWCTSSAWIIERFVGQACSQIKICGRELCYRFEAEARLNNI
jgi:hypothetical protein